MITIKRHGHAEKFDERKLYASVFAAALNCHLSDEESEHIANEVSQDLIVLIRNNKHTNTKFIKEEIIKSLNTRGNKEIATMYKHHLDIC